MEILNLFTGRNFKLFSVGVIVLAFLLPKMVFGAEYCADNSAIDQVSFFVGQTFSDALGRAPGDEGQNYWGGRLESLNATACKSANPTMSAPGCERSNNAQVLLQILGSPESVSKNGSIDSNSAFLTVLYQVLLRRAPDGPGLKLYLSALDSGNTRLSVVMKFLASDEYRHRFACTASGTPTPSCWGAASIDPVPSFVAQTQKDILGVPPDAASQAALASQVTSNLRAMCRNSAATAYSSCDRVIEAQTILNLLNDPAYRRTNPPLADNKTFVTVLYKHLLQRAPDAGGLQFHTESLNQSNDKVSAIYSFLASDEYRGRFACYAGTRQYTNLGVNGHPLKQAAYSDSGGVSFEEQLTLVQNLGAQWYRFDLEVPSTEATLAEMDLLVKQAVAHGVRLLPILMPQVDRVHNSPSTVYRQSYDAAFNLVSRYKAYLHVWELSNEEDDIAIHRSGEPDWPRATPDGDQVTDYNPQRYAITEAVLHGLADGVRAADSGALRVINFGGWVHTGFLQKLETSGVPYDIIGVHWYEFMGEIPCPGQGPPCPASPQRFNVVQRLQTITKGKPMWITETNFWPARANIEDMPTYLTRVLGAYSGSPAVYPFQTVIIYELLDEPYLRGDETQQGLVSTVRRPDGGYGAGSVKPAYQAVQRLFKH